MIAGVIPEFRWGAGFAQAWRPAYPVDGVRYWDRPRTVDRIVTLTGVEDAWITGTDYYASGRVRWLGRGQYAADAGFAGLLRAARDSAVRLYPDPATAPDWFVAVYVEGVDEIRPEAEADFTMASELTVRGASGAPVAPVWLALTPTSTTGVTLTRAGTATRFNHSSGLVETAAVDVLRTTWRRTWAGRFESGLLVEGAATNRLLRSQEFNTTWSLSNAAVDPNSAVAPDGTTTADGIAENTAAGVTHGVTQSYTCTSGATQVLSVFARAAGRRWLVLQLSDAGFGNSVRAWFDLRAGTVGTSGTVGTGTYTAHYITPVGGGWWRCTLVGRPATAITTAVAAVFLAPSDNTITYTGDGVSGVFAWGAQVEDNATAASSYVATVGSTVARSADVFSRTLVGTAVAAPRVLTLYTRVILNAPWAAIPDFRYFVFVGDVPRRIGVGKTTAVGAFLEIDGDIVAASVAVSPPLAGDVVEVAAVLRADGAIVVTVAVNAVVVGAATSLPPSTDPLVGGWGAQALTIGLGDFGIASHVVVGAGVRSLPEMRALAGVTV